MIRSTLILLGTFALLVAPGAAQDKPRTKADKPSVYVVDVTGMQ
jgi:hypothetical protein